jgi:Polyketide cyclase / dehydrase and lipid transport
MPHITETATIPRDPATLWNEIGGFGCVGEWHPLLDSVETFGAGTDVIRIARAKGGGEQIERLQSLDASGRVYRYTMERTSMPVRDYTGEFRIEPADDAASRITWSASFELTAEGDGRAVEAVRKFLHAGTESLKSRYGASG